MDYDLVIIEGTVIQENDVVSADIGIKDGKILSIGYGLVGKETINAHGKLVIPGGIDPHVHLEMQAGSVVSSDNWESGTQAAAIGGTTTVLDFIEPELEQTLIEAFLKRKKQADHGTCLDYSLHMTLSDAKPTTVAQIPQIIQAGITSFKTYTTYDFKLNDDELIAIMKIVSQSGGLVLNHAENDAIIQYMRNGLLEEGKVSPRYHPLSRPAIAEGEAIERVLALASITQTPIYIVHVSTDVGSRAIERAIARNQIAVGETCPQYLILCDDEYLRPGFEPAKYICSPPLRTKMDNASLWDAIGKGTLQTIGTDHCPFFYHGQKDIGKDRFTKIPGGIPGIESRMALVYTYGVLSGRINLQQWVQVTSTNASKTFGLYPQKGTLLPGSDADIVVFDPETSGVISANTLHENVDYTPYEGFKYQGYPVLTISGGRIIAKAGEFIGKHISGKFLPRKPFSIREE